MSGRSPVYITVAVARAVVNADGAQDRELRADVASERGGYLIADMQVVTFHLGTEIDILNLRGGELLAQRGHRKRYRTLETLLSDVRAIVGAGAPVTLRFEGPL